MTNRDRVERGLELLRKGLGAFIAREIGSAIRNRQVGSDVLRSVAGTPGQASAPVTAWDVAAQLRAMWELWNQVFRFPLGPSERSLVSELRGHRNDWAHQKRFSSDDTYRALDSATRLLTAVSAREASEVETLKTELLRARFEQEARNTKKRVARTALVETEVTSDLEPWRTLITPHPDVAGGQYAQAEFAADLWQVMRGEGADEYRDPGRFFRRTYLTESLRELLLGVVRRLGGAGGEPVIELQTNFGGGKTHSMLALYHLFSGVSPGDLTGVDDLLAGANLALPPGVRRVVLVGNRISPAQPQRKPDGTEVRTLWGELAWQLGGREAFERIRLDDEKATSPGQALADLFRDHGPCLVLVDEWVAYARQLRENDHEIAGGTFETQFTFAQALTESAKQAPNCCLVVSLPASSDDRASDHGQTSEDEVGGVRGREALSRLRNVVERVASPWKPASAEEGFEIVRRRLFERLPGHAYKHRNRTAQAFAHYYRDRKGEFPPECGEGDYERRIEAAYPIHPELFDRLYGDWSALLRFQRTRGVLRLMAAVIHALWEGGDQSPLILPSMLPIENSRVQPELTRYLTDNWIPIIDKDVDGPDSLPLKLDGEVPTLGKRSAARRVARPNFQGGAPKTGAGPPGHGAPRGHLGGGVPRAPTGTFDDALRRLAARATHLYRDGDQSWYDTQPTVTRTAEQRGERLSEEALHDEIARRVRKAVGQRGRFAAVHPLPASGADVADERAARLVVLGSEAPHRRGGDSRAQRQALEVLEQRGSGPRIYRNALVFLAADGNRLPSLIDAARAFLAWRSIVDDRETLNLNAQQTRQAEAQTQTADSTVAAQLPETWRWLLVPGQESPQAPITWETHEIRVAGGLVERAEQRAFREEAIIGEYGPTTLRGALDGVPLWRGRDHLPVRELMDDFASYLYLPRLLGPGVLAEAIGRGLALLGWRSETFAYADGHDGDRYRGLQAGMAVRVSADSPGLLVKPERAWSQLEREQILPPPPPPPAGRDPIEPEPKPKRRFYGAVQLDPQQVGPDAGRVAEEVIAHLVGQEGATVEVSLEIAATKNTGFPDRVVRTVSENARTLKFSSPKFETE